MPSGRVSSNRALCVHANADNGGATTHCKAVGWIAPLWIGRRTLDLEQRVPFWMMGPNESEVGERSPQNIVDRLRILDDNVPVDISNSPRRG